MRAAIIQSLREQLRQRKAGRSVSMPELDALIGGLAQGAIHEVLAQGPARCFAMLLARAGLGSGVVAWCVEGSDAERWYEPAAARIGIPVDRLIKLRTANTKEMLWAYAECLRCKGVGVSIAAISGRLTSIDARRLQLAAELGGGIGILLRDATARSMHYAAATRWLVEPQPGEPDIQRWRVTLLHGHGGQIDRSIGLEMSRETHLVRAYQELADQPAQTTPSRATG